MLTILFSLIFAQELPDIDIIVISDLNGSYGSTEYSSESQQAVNYIVKHQPDVVLVTGDMIAGQKRGLPYRTMWDSFHNTVTEPLEHYQIPLAVSPGNHDASGYKRFLQERSIFIDEWTKHKPDIKFVDDRHFPLYYAFFVHDILFVSIDNTVMRGPDVEQLSWIDEILSTKARKKIVYGHLPLIAFAKGKEKEYVHNEMLQKILEKHHVDAYISGHHHTYYPGIHHDMHMVSAPCLGSGSRFLQGASERSAKGIVRIQIIDDHIHVEGYDASSDFSVIPKNQLPRYIENSYMRIWRDDIKHYPIADLDFSISNLE